MPPADSRMKSPDFTTQPEFWPELHLENWKDTCATLHMWTQIVGKVRLALSPPMSTIGGRLPLYVSARGLTTSPIPYRASEFSRWSLISCVMFCAFATSDGSSKFGRCFGRVQSPISTTN